MEYTKADVRSALADIVALDVPLLAELLGKRERKCAIVRALVALSTEILNVYHRGRPLESGKRLMSSR